MNDLVLDASLALQWFLEDEADRKYSLSVLSSPSTKRAVVPVLWFYEVGNGLLMAQRRKRITQLQVNSFLKRLRLLPNLAQTHRLTNYDAAYLALAAANHLPLATNDGELRRAATAAHVALF